MYWLHGITTLDYRELQLLANPVTSAALPNTHFTMGQTLLSLTSCLRWVSLSIRAMLIGIREASYPHS